MKKFTDEAFQKVVATPLGYLFVRRVIIYPKHQIFVQILLAESFEAAKAAQVEVALVVIYLKGPEPTEVIDRVIQHAAYAAQPFQILDSEAGWG